MQRTITRREHDLYDAVSPVVEPLGAELVDLEIENRDGNPLVRVIIEGPDGVDTDLCERVSSHVLPVLELEDESLMREAQLEVTSPGVRRRMRRSSEFERYTGREVVVKCYATYEGKKEWQGTLTDYDGSEIDLTLDDGSSLKLPEEQVASVRLFFDAEAALESGGKDDHE